MSMLTSRRNRAAAFAAAAAAVLAPLSAAGCAHQPAAARPSVASCTRFGIQAIRHRVTVTALPPACQGLTRTQVNVAVGAALRTAAVGAGGKARQRERIAAASRFLAHLVTTVPAQRAPQAPAPGAGPPSRALLGLIALGTWVITAALGLWMMAGWAPRSRSRAPPARSRDPSARTPEPPARAHRPPPLNAAHLGLALTGLLIWAAYLATGVTGVAWAACVLLPAVAGLGMTLVFAPSRSAAGPAAGRPPVLVIGVHVAFATATILFAFLTAIGPG